MLEQALFICNTYKTEEVRTGASVCKNVISHQYEDTSHHQQYKHVQNAKQYLQRVCEWLNEKYLQLSPGRSSVTVFTLWTKEISMEPEIHIDNMKIPECKNP